MRIFSQPDPADIAVVKTDTTPALEEGKIDGEQITAINMSLSLSDTITPLGFNPKSNFSRPYQSRK